MVRRADGHERATVRATKELTIGAFENLMSYRVLARAYRSATFEEVVGQEVIATTLTNAIRSGRIHHGYLFTGTRGVGKTSMARILAKALNCLSAPAATPTPCGTCESCRAVAEGQDIDVVEIDAASNTGVDNIRELRSNATLRPARARFKVYIIDEVHMLSTQAFNALLKTLEEPPSHVKFILATTEAHKVPATIVSRCQRFDFKSIEVVAMSAHLARIAKVEGVEAEEAALRRVARLANGSMRDALSLLDQLLSFDAHRLTLASVDEIVPPPHDELSLALVDCLGSRDAAGALRIFDQALQTGRTIERFCDHLIDHVRSLMLLRVCGAETDLVDAASTVRGRLVEQSAKFDAATYVYMITLLEELRRNVKYSGAARALADAAITRLAMAHQFSDLTQLLERLAEGGSVAGAPTGGGDVKKNVDVIRPAGNAAAKVGAAPASRSGSVGAELRTATAAPPPRRAEWERAARDPLVERVKAAVDGTLLDVRPTKIVGADGEKGTTTPDGAGGSDASESEEGEASLLGTE